MRNRFFEVVFLVGISSLFLSCIKMPIVEEESGDKMCKLTIGLDEGSLNDAIKIVETFVTDDSEHSESGTKWDPDLIPNRIALDTLKYLLKIEDSKGLVLYDGLYKDRPQELEVRAGNYTISLLSGSFKEGVQDIPLFGEVKKVKAIADSSLTVKLVSKQMTGGIRIDHTSNFRNYFKGLGLYFRKDTNEYKCRYTMPFKYFFFYPGEVSVYYKNKDGHESFTPYDKPTYKDTFILKRNLKATDLVSIVLDYDLSAINSGNIGFKIDTNRNRYYNIHNVAFFAPYGSVSVVYARTHIGDTVDLYGYIVGGDATGSNFKRSAPFNSKTHIVVAKENWQTLREKTMAIELPNGNIRKELNLVDNPDMLKKKIVIHGVIVDSYFSEPGLKNIKWYQLYK